ncbi:MAG: 5-(carboxyamino)imidazole ribonucleotide synthase, partial [Pseudorhodoplanes sp.]|nr:5-(carboxyamino)imidazole ribonucleotide synthase [Pseudorhodoplanes sp.]
HCTFVGGSVSHLSQHIRGVAVWPLAMPVLHGRVEMTNLIGEEVHEVERWLRQGGTSVHLYGKAEARPGRKMGHVTRVSPEGGRTPKPPRE